MARSCVTRTLPSTVVDQLAALQANDGVLAERCRNWIAQLPESSEIIEVPSPAKSTATLDDLREVRAHLDRLRARGPLEFGTRRAPRTSTAFDSFDQRAANTKVRNMALAKLANEIIT